MTTLGATSDSHQAGGGENPQTTQSPHETLPLLVDAYSKTKDPKTKKTIAKQLAIAIWQAAAAAMEGGTDAGAFHNLADGILSGWPASYPLIMPNTIRVGLAPIAVIGAIRIILEQHLPVSEKLLFSRRVWEGAALNMRLTGFILPLFFFLISSIIQAIKHESATTPVDISNVAAGFVIAVCVLIGSLGGVKSYFDNKRRNDFEWELEDQDKVQRFLRFISTNPVSRRVITALDGASAVHWLVYSMEVFFKVNTSTPEQIARYALTGAAGLFTAIFTGGAEPEKKWYFKPIDIVFRFIKATAMGVMLYNAFSRPNASEFWGAATLRYQFYFWLAAFPLFVILAQIAARAIKHYFYPNLTENERATLTPTMSSAAPSASLPFVNEDGTLAQDPPTLLFSTIDLDADEEVDEEKVTGTNNSSPSLEQIRKTKCNIL